MKVVSQPDSMIELTFKGLRFRYQPSKNLLSLGLDEAVGPRLGDFDWALGLTGLRVQRTLR